MASRNQIINTLRTAYAHVDNFLLHSSKGEHVIDVPTFSTDNAVPGFDVENPTNKMFSLLQIDKKMMTSNIDNIGQCDGAIISDDEISFLEFKTNATTNKLNKECGKAESQIFMTAMRMNWALRRVNQDFMSLAKIDGYVCFNTYPKGGANYQNRQIRFLQRTGIELFYSNEKTL
ncbi:MAG: hypothetical protein J5708_01335 [Bacteroidales bacterium]|nr:hypothetical protein [Bacteroidales bacterium]